jgi:hypothetical protein
MLFLEKLSELSVHMIQLENHWMNVDKIWYERFAIGDYSKVVLSNCLTRFNNKIAEGGTSGVKPRVAPIAIELDKK